MERRNTVQREIIYCAVQELMNHPTSDEVYNFIKEKHPSISRATVYRNLNLLVEEGKLRRVEVPEGPDRFDHSVNPHYHVICAVCGRSFDVDMEPLSGMEQRIRDPHGFEFLSYELLFKGICPACRKTNGSK